MKITKSELRRFIKEELVNQGKLSEGEARRYNFMVTHKESKATSQVNAENGNEAIMLARDGELKKHGGPEGDYKVEKITESRLRKMIREELEVVLTNEEAYDFFDINPGDLLSEFIDERELTKPEKKELKSLEKETPKKGFKDQYGDEEGESIYYATLTKKAKEEA